MDHSPPHTEDDTFEVLVKPDFETLNSLFNAQFPDANTEYFTITQIDYIHSYYWSHTVFGKARVDLLNKEITEMVSHIHKQVNRLCRPKMKPSAS